MTRKHVQYQEHQGYSLINMYINTRIFLYSMLENLTLTEQYLFFAMCVCDNFEEVF